jgi:hypothetical protein
MNVGGEFVYRFFPQSEDLKCSPHADDDGVSYPVRPYVKPAKVLSWQGWHPFSLTVV